METIVNIGTTKRNIVGVKFNKPFKDIKYREIMRVVEKKYPNEEIKIVGWCDVTKIKKYSDE